MFRIRGIHDHHLPSNQAVVAQVQAILRMQFPLLREGKILEIPERLRNPVKYRFRSADIRDSRTRTSAVSKMSVDVVQEGGYNTRNLGLNAHRFFGRIWSAMHGRGVAREPLANRRSSSDHRGK